MIKHSDMQQWYDSDSYKGESFYEFADRVCHAQCDFTDQWGVLGRDVIFGVTYEDLAYEANGVGELLYSACMLRGADDVEVSKGYRGGVGLIYTVKRGEVVRDFSDGPGLSAFARAKRWIMNTPLLD